MRPGVPLPGGEASTGASLMAAGNEFESFQVAVRSQGTPLDGVSVTAAGPLVGPGGARIPPSNLTIYRESYYDVRTPSDAEGARGEWPDPLIPTRDYLYGERRDAFPAGAPGGTDVVAWVDVLVPRGQAAGIYHGRVLVSAGDGGARRVPVRLQVLGFSIPPTSSLRSSFTLDTGAVCEVLDGSACASDDAESWRSNYLFARAGLENRLTVSNAYLTGRSGAPLGRERRLFERFERPLLDGAHRAPAAGLRPPRLRGARLTAIDAYGATYPSGTGPADYGCAERNSACLATWKSLASRLGFASRFFLYLCDEPGADPRVRWPVCRQAARRVADGVWPAVTKLVTTWIQSARRNGAEAAIDTIVVGVDQMANRPGYARAGDQRPAYNSFLRKPGRTLWLYTACLQYSCDRARNPYWRGWPGYGIDQPPSQARAMGWLAFEYGASGELYYSVDASLRTAWRSQYRFGGNGDGNLFYPGLPGGDPQTGAPAIGGTDPIPIESIRLKRIRDGREDYEYLRRGAAAGDGAEAARIVRGLLGGPDRATYGTTFSQPQLDSARCRLALLLGPVVGGCH